MHDKGILYINGRYHSINSPSRVGLNSVAKEADYLLISIYNEAHTSVTLNLKLLGKPYKLSSIDGGPPHPTLMVTTKPRTVNFSFAYEIETTLTIAFRVYSYYDTSRPYLRGSSKRNWSKLLIFCFMLKKCPSI